MEVPALTAHSTGPELYAILCAPCLRADGGGQRGSTGRRVGGGGGVRDQRGGAEQEAGRRQEPRQDRPTTAPRIAFRRHMRHYHTAGPRFTLRIVAAARPWPLTIVRSTN